MYIKLPHLNAVKIKETICFSFSFMQKRWYMKPRFLSVFWVLHACCDSEFTNFLDIMLGYHFNCNFTPWQKKKSYGSKNTGRYVKLKWRQNHPTAGTIKQQLTKQKILMSRKLPKTVKLKFQSLSKMLRIKWKNNFCVWMCTYQALPSKSIHRREWKWGEISTKVIEYAPANWVFTQ